jgi:hypothetical protein
MFVEVFYGFFDYTKKFIFNNQQDKVLAWFLLVISCLM